MTPIFSSPVTKKEIRALVQDHFRVLSPEERDERSARACRSLYEKFLRGRQGQSVGLFMSMKNEVQTAALISILREEGSRRLLVPRCDDGETIRFYPMGDISDYELSGYGIPEPTCPIEDEEVPELLVVPGVAFGRQDGSRVGHGVGYYDRYLAKHASELRLVVGLGLEFQIFDTVPTDPHDYPLQGLAWEDDTALCGPSR